MKLAELKAMANAISIAILATPSGPERNRMTTVNMEIVRRIQAKESKGRAKKYKNLTVRQVMAYVDAYKDYCVDNNLDDDSKDLTIVGLIEFVVTNDIDIEVIDAKEEKR